MNWVMQDAKDKLSQVIQRAKPRSPDDNAARAAGEAGHEKLLRRYTTTRIADVVEGAYVRAQRRHNSHRQAIQI